MSLKIREILFANTLPGELSWHDLRAEGVADYYDVLAELGRLSLRPPIAIITGPNVAAREHGVATLKILLKGRR